MYNQVPDHQTWSWFALEGPRCGCGVFLRNFSPQLLATFFHPPLPISVRKEPYGSREWGVKKCCERLCLAIVHLSIIYRTPRRQGPGPGSAQCMLQLLCGRFIVNRVAAYIERYQALCVVWAWFQSIPLVVWAWFQSIPLVVWAWFQSIHVPLVVCTKNIIYRLISCVIKTIILKMLFLLQMP